MTASILRFSKPLPRCAICGTPHRPLRREHRLCWQCFSWTRAAWHQRQMAGLFEGCRNLENKKAALAGAALKSLSERGNHRE